MTLLHYVFLLQLIWSTACRNIAKDYGEATMPGAKCEKINTYYIASKPDTAVCSWAHKMYVCNEYGPECKFLRDIPPEVPVQ